MNPKLHSLVLPLAIILILGLTVVWSTTPSLLLSQFVFLLIGICAFLVISLVDAQLLKDLSHPAYFLCIFLLVLTYIVGTVSRGSLRWIDLGPFRLQTSEFAKPLLILAWANFFTQDTRRNFNSFLKKLVLVGLPFALVFFQPDLGSSMVIALSGLFLIIQSGAGFKYPLILAITLALLSPLAFQLMHNYQKERLISFINPYSDPVRSGYNVIQSTVAVGSGQIFGKGVRQGTQSHLRFLPERHTDFAFASFAEEFGFLGVTILVICFYFLLRWLLQSSLNSDPFASLVALGAFWIFFIQTVVNVGMNLGVMPVTGITLPFISYGGSSLISLFILLGLVFASAKSKIVDN